MIDDPAPSTPWGDQSTPVNNPSESEEYDFARLAANVLLTVQALQALHQAFDRKFTR